MGYYSSFIVKIQTSEAEGRMRGWIQHVASQEQVHFLSVEKMQDFMRAHLIGTVCTAGYSSNGDENKESVDRPI